MSSSRASDPHLPSPPPLILTGERTLPDIDDERYWFERHVVAYLTVVDQLRASPPQVVLDAGCGEGYGLDLLAAAGARRVIGVDLDPQVVAHVAIAYAAQDPRIEVARAELSALPLSDSEVDLTVSFQVIEHLHDIPSYLASLRRVTRPGGQVWIATPNRLTFTPDSDVPVNPFHVKEFTATELRAELAASGLAVEQILGVRHGQRIRTEEARLGRGFVERITAGEPRDWDPSLRAAVHATRPQDFEVTEQDLDTSLDLIAIARVPALA